MAPPPNISHVIADILLICQMMMDYTASLNGMWYALCFQQQSFAAFH